jgi:hypothetical protein
MMLAPSGPTSCLLTTVNKAALGNHHTFLRKSSAAKVDFGAGSGGRGGGVGRRGEGGGMLQSHAPATIPYMLYAFDFVIAVSFLIEHPCLR